MDEAGVAGETKGSGRGAQWGRALGTGSEGIQAGRAAGAGWCWSGAEDRAKWALAAGLTMRAGCARDALFFAHKGASPTLEVPRT